MSKFIIEGEEEVGGESIAEYVRKQKAKLKADFALVCDTEMFAPDLPTLCVGLRGLIYTEIEAIGPKTDLHSGMYGGAAPNPFFALTKIIAQLKDETGACADSRLLQQREGAERGGTQSVEAVCHLTKSITARPKWARRS